MSDDESVMTNGESPPPQPRRARRGGRLIDQPFTAKLVASQLLLRADELRGPRGESNGSGDYRSPAEKAADIDLADLLKTAAEELRAI